VEWLEQLGAVRIPHGSIRTSADKLGKKNGIPGLSVAIQFSQMVRSAWCDAPLASCGDEVRLGMRQSTVTIKKQY
jgi:hypothetical protein